MGVEGGPRPDQGIPSNSWIKLGRGIPTQFYAETFVEIAYFIPFDGIYSFEVDFDWLPSGMKANESDPDDPIGVFDPFTGLEILTNKDLLQKQAMMETRLFALNMCYIPNHENDQELTWRTKVRLPDTSTLVYTPRRPNKEMPILGNMYFDHIEENPTQKIHQLFLPEISTRDTQIMLYRPDQKSELP